MAHTFDTSLRIPVAGTSVDDPLEAAYTCGAGTTVLVVMPFLGDVVPRQGGPPTYNDIELTKAGDSQGVTECSAALWYLLDPPTGEAYTISVPNTGTLPMVVVVASGKAQAGYTSVLDDSAGQAVTGSNPTTGVMTATVAGDILFAGVATGDNKFEPSARTGTSLTEEDLGTWGIGAQYYLMAGTGDQAMTWTEATSDDYGAAGAAFKETLIVSASASASASASSFRWPELPGPP